MTSPTNVLLITADDLDFSVIGFVNGPEASLTPNLDALASRGHVFLQNRTASPICMPSRSAMMTGRVPHRSGATGFLPVNYAVPTLVTQLQAAGYFTACLHKVTHMQPPSAFPWDFIVPREDRHTEAQAGFVEQAISEARALDLPFFINCNFDDPHRPFYGSAGAAQMDHDLAIGYAIENPVEPDEVVVPPHLEDLPDIRVELAQYSNSVRRMDKSLGNVLGALERSGAADDTIIVFCADHGMPFPFSKATCYDHGTRVPAILYWPGMASRQRVETPTLNLDIAPTLLDLLGIEAIADIDGRSWLELLDGGPSRDFVVTQVDHVVSGTNYATRAIQNDRFSLVFAPWSDGQLPLKIESMTGLSFSAMQQAATEPAIGARVKQYTMGIVLAFYDLGKDPGQRQNVIEDPSYSSQVEVMKARLLEEMERTGDPQAENLRAVLMGSKASVQQSPQRYKSRS